MRKVFAWFLPYWKHRARGLSLVVLITLVGIATRTLYPFVFKFVIDALEVDPDPQSARFWVLAILGIGLVRELSQWMLPALRYLQNTMLAMDIRLNLFGKILTFDHKFFNRFRSGDLITRLTDDIDAELKISWYACSGVMRPVEAGFTLLFSVGLMLTLNWQLTLLAVLPLPFIVWVMARTEHIQEQAYSERQRATSKTVDVLESAFSGIRIVIGYAAEQAQYRLLKKALKRRVTAEERVVYLRSLLESLSNFLNQVGVLVVIFVGGWFVIKDRMSLGDFYAFYAYLSGLAETIWTLSWFFVSTKLAEASVDRLVEMESGTPPVWGDKTDAPAGAALVLQNVSFSFQEQEMVTVAADAVSLTIKPQETVALVGPVGCGKSTLLHLAAGILPPDSGQVQLGEIPIVAFGAEARASLVGFVPQESLLFTGSVLVNVTLDREGISSTDAEAALYTAVADDEFPLDKEIHQGGVGLSGGQRARVALARALAGRPPFLVLDDVTASLDAATEGLFWQRLKAMLPDATVLVATHREATARVSDRVIWLEQGAILHEGTHEQLLVEFKNYRRLFARH
ncbi:MAG: ABC transporter ATP-binding protein [Candidatus Delongbacteria bacterium]|nr:ABC transporter ATP-binding protein [Candidatus Delongbacteria bacterium]